MEAAPAAASSGPAFSPLYRQIKALLVRSLNSGEWKPGELIPSEQELASRFGVSQGTVRKAIDEMAMENLLTRRQGRGTFVATHAEQNIQYRFLRLAPDKGPASGMARHFMDCRRMRAPAEVARALELKPGDSVLQIHRTLSRMGRPVVLDDLWLPERHFEGLSSEVINGYAGTLYALFEERYRVHMVRADEKLRAVAAAPDAAALLGVAPGAPLLSVERVAFTYGDRPVELRRGLYFTESDHYRNQLN